MSRILAYREAQNKRRRRRRVALLMAVGLLCLGLFYLCTEPDSIPQVVPVALPEALSVKSVKQEKKAAAGGLSRPTWNHHSEQMAKLLAAVSQELAITPHACRLQKSLRWEFTMDTASGRVFDFQFVDVAAGQVTNSGPALCLKELWSVWRYQGPELFQGETIRLSFIFKAVDGHP